MKTLRLTWGMGLWPKGDGRGGRGGDGAVGMHLQHTGMEVGWARLQDRGMGGAMRLI